MNKQEISFQYQVFNSIKELSNDEKKLIDAAIVAKNNSYSPYSKFKVGVALKLDDNIIVTGSNQENAAFPSGLCAERVALFYANANYPDKLIKQIVIVGGKEDEITLLPLTPCGACRQVLLESEMRQDYCIEFILVGSQKIYKISNSKVLIPLSFNQNTLGAK